MPMSDGFHALLLEGVFHRGPDLVCSTKEGTKDVSEALRPLLGTRVRIAAHHCPPWPEPTRWGGGSCAWQENGGICPAGHAWRPTWLYNVSVEGVLEQTDDLDWRVVGFDGTTTDLELHTMMDGHFGRVLAASVVSVEKMRDALAASRMTEGVDPITSLQDVIDRVSRGEGG